MKKILAVLLALGCAPAFAQSVQQSGSVTPTHPSCWAANGVIKDCGSATNPFANTFGLIGGPFCINSGPTTGAYNAFCMQASSTGGILSVYSHGGATGGFSFVINGVTQGIPTTNIPTTNGDFVCFSGTSGSLTDCNYSPTTLPIVIGTTPVTSGTSGDILYNNSGKAGNFALGGDCTLSVPNITCTKTSGSSFGTFATQNYATPPAIGGTTPAAGSFNGLTATGSFTATGLVTNADLVNQSTTVNGATCTLGSSCTVSATPTGSYILSYASGSWVCTSPTGAVVSTSGTTTSGIAECNSAAITNHGNLRVSCAAFGNSVTLAASSSITLGGGVISYNFDGCNLVLSGGANLTYDSMPDGSSQNWDGGWIQCQSNSTTCIHIYPKTFITGVGSYFSPTSFSLPFIYMTCASSGAMASAIDFDTTYGHTVSENTAIYAGFYKIGFILGYDGTHYCPVSGIKVENPTNTYEAFGQNKLFIGYITGFYTNGIQEGTASVTQSSQALATNEWHFVLGSGGSTTNGVLTYGFLDQWYGTISVNSGSQTYGINFAASTANGNWFNIPQIQGTTAIEDSSSSVKNYGFANGGGYKTGGTW